MSIHQLYNISRRSFLAYDAAMNTIAQNVANADSEGYSRRRITLRADNYGTSGFFSGVPGAVATGNGVTMAGYERVRDGMLERSAWHANAYMGGSEEEHRVMAALQSIFSVQTEGSLSSQLDKFWGAWSDLADNPADNGIRLTLRSQASSLASTLNRMAADVTDLQEETERVLHGTIGDVNKMLAEVAELNKTITHSRYAGTDDLVAADRRDVLISKLSEMAGIQVREESNGAYRVTLDGMTLVADGIAEKLRLDTTGTTPQILFSDSSVPMTIPEEGGGRLGGLLRAFGGAIPDTIDALDSIARTLVTEVNALHRDGYGLDGSTGNDFFHYQAGPPEQGVSAAEIRLSDAVLNDSKAIAASEGDPSQGFNDSDVANKILALREAALMNGGTESVETFAINLVTGIGSIVERANNLYESHASFANHVKSMADGVKAVSLEEEMTNLIQYQQSYAASARVLTAAEEMMDALLAI